MSLHPKNKLKIMNLRFQKYRCTKLDSIEQKLKMEFFNRFQLSIFNFQLITNPPKSKS